MATKQEFRTYMEQNKANLNQEALKGADMNMVYNEWRDTGSISKNYIKQPATQQPNTQVTPQPVTQVTPQVQPNTQVAPQVQTQVQPKQQITPQVEQKQPLQNYQTKAELPQTSAPKTMPATEVKPGEAPILETPKYQQQLDKFLQTGSIAEARNKLKEGLANGTIDKATYDKAESYLVSNLYKKEEAQTQEKAIQNDQNNLFNSLRGGQTISNDILNTTEGKQAQSRFRNLQLLESKTPNQIASLINGGLLNVGSQVYNDLKTYNPELLKQAENIAKMQVFTPTEVKKDETGKEITKTENTQFSITEKIMELLDPKNVIDVKTSLSQDEKINELNSQLSAKEAELKEKKRQIDNVYRDLEKQLSGTGATKSYIQAKASRMAEDLIRDYNTMQDDYNIIAGDLNRRTEMITYDVQRQEKERQSQLQMLEFAYGIQREEQAYQRELEKEERMRGYTMEDRQYQEELQQRQLEQQYAYQYGDLNSDNPTLQNIAIERAVASMYENYPIPGMESQSVKVQKVKNLMAQGMTGTQAIAQVESEIRNSQRYKDYLAYERARITPQTDTKFGFQNVGEGTIAVTDPATGKVTFVNSQGQPTSGGSIGDYYSQFRVTQDVGAKSPNSKDTGWNGGTPGIDFAMPEGSQVIATIGGKVVGAESNRDYGTQVIIEDANGNKHMYSHLSKPNVKIGDVIQPGQSIALSGNTGFSTGPHLDYRVKGADGKWLDPKQFLGGPTTNGGDLQTLGQFLKDNQSRGPGYSEEDVKAFDSKIDRFIQNNDEKGMALAFRKNIFEDKDFKQEFDNTKKFQTGLIQVEKLISDYEKAGKSTNALKAMAEKVARTTGLTTDEALAQMQTQMGFVLANYIKSISGTAASDAEVQRLMGNMANISNVSSLNKTILSQVKSNSQASLESMIDTRMYGLPESFKYKAFEDIYGTKEKTTTGTSTPKIYNNVNDIKKDFLNY